MKYSVTFIKSFLLSTLLFNAPLNAAEASSTPLNRSPLFTLSNYSEDFKETLFTDLVGPFLSAQDFSQLKLSGKEMHRIVEKIETKIFQFVTCDPDSEIYQAYINLPCEWQTPTLIARIIMQAEEISTVPGAFDPEMVNFLVAWNNFKAKSNKIDGFRNGNYGFTKHTEAMDAINIFDYKKDKKWAREEEFYHLLYVKRAITAAHALLDEEVSKGISQAIGTRFEGLQMATYRHRKNPWKARKILDTGVAQLHLAALKKKLCYVGMGAFGYTRSEPAAKKLAYDFFGLPLPPSFLDTFIPPIEKAPIMEIIQEVAEPFIVQFIGAFLTLNSINKLKSVNSQFFYFMEKIEQNALASITENRQSELYQAYLDLPPQWQTPTMITRIIHQAREIQQFPQVFGYKMNNFLVYLGTLEAPKNKISDLSSLPSYQYYPDRQKAEKLILNTEEKYRQRLTLREILTPLFNLASTVRHHFTDKAEVENAQSSVPVAFTFSSFYEEEIRKGNLEALHQEYSDHCQEDNTPARLYAHHMVHKFFGLPYPEFFELPAKPKK